MLIKKSQYFKTSQIEKIQLNSEIIICQDPDLFFFSISETYWKYKTAGHLVF